MSVNRKNLTGTRSFSLHPAPRPPHVQKRLEGVVEWMNANWGGTQKLSQ